MKSLAGVELTTENAIGQGRFVRVFSDKQISKLLAAKYGRGGLCLKVLRAAGAEWEGVPVVDVARLQNIGAMHGVAPRIYEIVRVADDQVAQVTDFAAPAGEPSLKAIEAVTRFLQEAGVGTAKRTGPNGAAKWDLVTSVKNWGGDLFLDWGGLYLTKPERYLAEVAKRAAVNITRAKRGQKVSRTYQAVKAIGLNGSRDIIHRIEKMELLNIDFKGKTVLDLGCNLGAFCHYAAKRGAKRVTGIDLPILADPAREIANWLGYWNIDFIGAELPEIELGGSFDIVLALSVCNHMGGYGKWMAEACNDLLILEGHGGDKPERYTAEMGRDFAEVDVIGFTTDSMRRPVIIGRK